MTHPPWGQPLPPRSSALAPPPPAPAPPGSTPAFSSSFSAFGLPQRVQTPSNLTMQLQGANPNASDASLGGVAFGGGGGGASLAGGQNAGGGGQGGAGAPFVYSAVGGSALFGGGGGLAAPGYPFPLPSTSSNGPRRPSMLAGDATMIESSDDEDAHDASSSDAGGLRRPTARGGLDEMMSLSPASAYEHTLSHHLPPSALGNMSFAARRSRSRSTSESNGNGMALPPGLFPFSNVPPSPVTVARALQVGQKTPPPFLQRRLFKEGLGAGGTEMMQEDSASGRSSRSASSNEMSAPKGDKKGKGAGSALASALLDDDEEIEELTLTLSRSASAGAGEAADSIVRPVSRRPNLLPKTKSHLRVLHELKTESLPGEQAEVASEATMHRLSRAGAAAPPPIRSSCPPSLDARPNSASSSASANTGNNATTNTSLSTTPGGGGFARPKPPPNRFPEHANEEEDDLLPPLSRDGALSSGSSNDGEGGTMAADDVALEGGSDWGGMSVGGYGTEDEEERRSNVVWNGIRGGPGGASAVTVAVPLSGGSGMGRSPGHDRRATGGMDLEFATPSTPSSFIARPGKRKNNDDRFEPYAHQAFKRRAVSPAASLSLSPGFHAPLPPPPPLPASLGYKNPTPPPIPPSSLSLSISTSSSYTQPVAILSPTSSNFPPTLTASAAGPPHHHFFSAVSAGGGGSGFVGSGSRSVAGSPAGSVSSSFGTNNGGGGRGFSSFVLSERHRPISAREEMERRRREGNRVAGEAEGLGRMNLGGREGEGEEEEL